MVSLTVRVSSASFLRASGGGGRGEIHHRDQGVQYAAQDYVDLLQKYDVHISMAAQGKPEENSFSERLMRTFKEEEVDLSEYNDFADARSQIGRFLEDVYKTKRIHSSLGYLTPLGSKPPGGWLIRFRPPPKNHQKTVQL